VNELNSERGNAVRVRNVDSRPQNEEDVDNSKRTWVGADAVKASLLLEPNLRGLRSFGLCLAITTFTCIFKVWILRQDCVWEIFRKYFSY
jgi:hypothetical protein